MPPVFERPDGTEPLREPVRVKNKPGRVSTRPGSDVVVTDETSGDALMKAVLAAGKQATTGNGGSK